MHGKTTAWRWAASGALVAAAVGLAAWGAARIAERRFRAGETFRVRAEFASIAGVEAGDRVRVQGINAGVVEAVIPPQLPGQPVALVLRINAQLRPLIRKDAKARVTSDGVVGSKIVDLKPGLPNAPPLPDNDRINSENPLELADVAAEARLAVTALAAASAGATQNLDELKVMLGSIRRGEGSLGKLIRDDDAYRSLTSVSNRAEHTLRELDDNLAALKHAWPLSGYFRDRAYFDVDRVLYHPGADSTAQVLNADSLFDPGRAVLTDQGRTLLDNVAAWFKTVAQRDSEVVIAAFADTPLDPNRALILTQEQADAARAYLERKHGLASAGWFKARKVAAVGFGRAEPAPKPPAAAEPTAAPTRPAPPSRRLEVVVFTPKA